MKIDILHRLKQELPFYPGQQFVDPATLGIEGSYQDMWPGGMHRRAELEFNNLETLNAVIGAMRSADRRRVSLHHEERRQTNLIDQLESMAMGYWEDPAVASLTVIEEPARQTRRFIDEAAQGNIEGLHGGAVQDMQFLNVIMLGLNQHPVFEDGQRLDPQAGVNPYVTEDRAPWEN